MGGFSIWHWIILLVAAGTAAAVVGLLVWLAVRAAGKAGAMPAASPPPSTAARLQELAALRSQGLVSDVEYEHKRAALLRDL
ncbi:hypothetical protein CQ393_14520 [Stenotrophomonas sp. MYb238]|uniref:hypothetical protein n=1 Tax=Stenotrophomonas sp. MYb238 TaxID=2040281 RepID=UPI00129120FE|nr:hypothetical protein [Stenotrophomonas sp. MYb238]MQP77094.1 hypothetical protein [Stenotrophomonas sp. MYb238]